MLQIHIKKMDSGVRVAVSLKDHGFVTFGAELFDFKQTDNERVFVNTWDKKILDCPDHFDIHSIIQEALGKSDLLGLKMPKADFFPVDAVGILNLDSWSEKFIEGKTMQVERIRGEIADQDPTHIVSYQGRQIGKICFPNKGYQDGEVREILIAALEKVKQHVEVP